MMNNKLSQRELEVLVLIARGYTNKKIGKLLYITEKSVNSHVARIFNKLDVHNKINVVIKALHLGIISLEGIYNHEE